MQTLPFLEAFKARTDLSIYKDNALLLFALELKFDIDNIHSVAEDALTDGRDDKKCDLVFVNKDDKYAVVAQGYYTNNPNKKSAPSNKASDLNTAVSWLLSVDIEQVPETIRSAALELRDALESEEIEVLELWYSHNLSESKNVAVELAAAENTVQSILKTLYPKSNCNEVRSTEVGIETLENWYKATNTPILVEDAFTVAVPGGYYLKTDEWEAYSTAIPAEWLYRIFHEHREKLFSANPRGYLGSIRSDKNINNGIKTSAKSNPDKFWTFNNGITMLVNEFKVTGKSRKRIRVSGVSIVNGAQTTGAIGSLNAPPSREAMVPARFIKCFKPHIVQEIVKYNNSQNKMLPSDSRSNDHIQKRLRQEFEDYPTNIIYTGARRGGAEDTIRRNPNLMSSDTVAQSLASFHGKPREAYNSKAQIWKSDKLYQQFFNEHTHSEHIIFVYSLHSIISSTKRTLMNRSRAGSSLTNDENNVLSFLRMRGAIYLMMASIGKSMETILGEPVTSKFLLRYKNTPTVSACVEHWKPIIGICLAFNDTLRVPLNSSLKKVSEIEEAINSFSMYVRGTRNANAPTYQEFSKAISVETWSNK